MGFAGGVEIAGEEGGSLRKVSRGAEVEARALVAHGRGSASIRSQGIGLPPVGGYDRKVHLLGRAEGPFGNNYPTLCRDALKGNLYRQLTHRRQVGSIIDRIGKGLQKARPRP